MEIIVEVTSLNNEIQEINARKLLDWRRKEGDRILDEKYVGDDKIVVREFIVEVAPYSDKDIEEFEKATEEQYKPDNKPRKPRKSVDAVDEKYTRGRGVRTE